MKTKGRGKSPLRWLRFVGLALLAGLIFYAGPDKMFAVARNSKPLWLLVAFVLNVPQLGLKAFRWFLLVRWQGLNLPYPRALLAYFGSLLVGFLTPGRLGEMAKAYTLKHECGVSFTHGLSSVVLDRAFDFYLLLSLGTLGVLRFAVVGTLLSWPVFVGICVLLLLPLLFLSEPLVRWVGGRMATLPLFHSKAEWIEEKVGQFADGLAVLTPGRILVCIGLTLLAYSVFFLQCLVSAWALGFSLDLLDLVLLMAATNFVSFAPISISGLGTREACLVYFLARVQPPHAEATAVLFGLSLFLVLFVGGGLIGFLCWQWAPIGLRKAAQEARDARNAD